MGCCRCRVGRRFVSLTGEKKKWERSLRIHGSSPVGGLISFVLSGLHSRLDDFGTIAGDWGFSFAFLVFLFFLISLSRKISTFVSIHFIFLLTSYTCQRLIMYAMSLKASLIISYETRALHPHTGHSGRWH